MKSVTVRTASHEDISELVTSVTELFREDAGEHDSSMDIEWPIRDGAAYYSSLMTDQACLLAVAGNSDRTVGHLVGKLSEPNSIRLERLAVLESMRVEPGYRRAGVGGLLVQHFLDWARIRDARQASVTAYVANQAAQRLYMRYGFSPMSVTLRAPL
jgi:GNAT superfamily N-acetyltransferase